MEWGIAAGIIICIFFVLDRIRRKRRNEAIEELEKNAFSEDNVNKILVQFEQDIAQNINLPNGIRNQQSYIYKHLVKKWYKEIIAKNRYNDEISEKIRVDIIKYISNLSQMNRASFPESESKGSNRAKHEEDVKLVKLKIEAIEDGFAAACGPGAVKELEIIRNRTPLEFSEDGEYVASDK